MTSKLVWLIVFLCLSQICYGDANEIDNLGNKLGWLNADEPCTACEEIVGNVISLRKGGASRDDMYDHLTDLCINNTDHGSILCMAWVDIKLDTVNYIIDNKVNLTAARFCAIYLQSYGCEDPNAESWSIPLPPLPSVGKKDETYGDGNETEVVHVLHLTDIHYDPLYKTNSNANCSQPLCCDSGSASESGDLAGWWGDYRVCDAPPPVVKNLFWNLQYVRGSIDWVYFTGDIVNHRSWVTTKKSNGDTIKEVLEMFSTTFRTIKVYPILGNHESHPLDFFSPYSVDTRSNVSSQWLYDLSAEEWLTWLPQSTEETIKRGGFYTVLAKPGFRIIALNSNVCYTSNIWLALEDNDPYGQLQWLVDVLTEAEKNGERVHILSHIPPGDVSCHKQWSSEFKKIVLRFSDTIAAQFNGHSHFDQFKLFYDSSDEPKSVAFNGGSFTSFLGSNPNYKIYEVDNATLAVTNYETWTFNLTLANSFPQWGPDYYKLYNFKGAYGLDDMSFTSLGDLYTQMASNNSQNDLVDRYYRYMHRNSDAYANVECDETCKTNLVCLIGATETEESAEC